MGRWGPLLVLGVALAVAPPAASADIDITREQAHRAVARYAAAEPGVIRYAIDHCRVGTRRAKCHVHYWGHVGSLPWVDPSTTDPNDIYDADYTAVVRRVRGHLLVHDQGACDDSERWAHDPTCDY